MPPKKRVTVRLKRPNPLFEKWLTEWKEEFKAKDSKMQFCFSTALQSLKKYPLPLEMGRDCKILRGFGDKLCMMLDEKLKRYKESGSRDNVENLNEIEDFSSNKKKYIPQYKSGGYAILLALYKSTFVEMTGESLTKNEIIKLAKFYCDSSFTKSESGSFYTAWSSMSTLINKNLVKKKGNPPKFSLTEEGVLISKKFYSDILTFDEEPLREIPKLIKDKPLDIEEKKSGNSEISNPLETIIFEPNTFDVILLVDTAETSGVKQAQDDPIISDLVRLGINFEIRHLKVGDYIWICRHCNTKVELVLPYIIERKRMDDFGQSIKDGRYHEQKFRLNQCGIQNVIYLIESYGKNVNTGLPMSTLLQAATNTLLHDGFQVKFSDNSRSTAYYLETMSKLLIGNYSGKMIMSCPKDNLESVSFETDLIPAMTFGEFSKIGSKHKKFTVKEMFIKHLLRLKGLSVDKALAIVRIYPTPKLLMESYRRDPDDAEKLLSKIIFGKGNKTIGPVISKVLCELYTKDF